MVKWNENTHSTDRTVVRWFVCVHKRNEEHILTEIAREMFRGRHRCKFDGFGVLVLRVRQRCITYSVCPVTPDEMKSSHANEIEVREHTERNE